MSLIRTAAGGTLTATAAVLSLTARLLDSAARIVRPSRGASESAAVAATEALVGEAPSQATTPTAAPTATDAPAAARTAPTAPRVDAPTAPAVDAPRVRTSESHIEELTKRPAAEVVKAVGQLSTDELRLLTEYEMAGRNRRTVMKAVERALQPPAGASEVADGSPQPR